LKVLFFGLGSIGQRYHRLLRDNFDLDIFALRSQKADYNRNGYFLKPLHHNLYSWDEVDRVKPDVAIITNPTYLHIDTAIQ